MSLVTREQVWRTPDKKAHDNLAEAINHGLIVTCQRIVENCGGTADEHTARLFGNMFMYDDLREMMSEALKEAECLSVQHKLQRVNANDR